mgnify:FL=1
MPQDKKIYVYFDNNVGVKFKVGYLYEDFQKGKEKFSFEFADEFFTSFLSDNFFDYDLQPYKARQYLPPEKTLFGVFSDVAPDRWGRLLMKRRERIRAEEQKQKKVNALYEADYVLGVFDEARMGALRFCLEENGEYLSAEKELSTPPFESLRTLEEASRQFEKEENLLNGKWLKLLLAPGSSLGGARPKATVKDVEGNLWIAKFPSKNDEYDMGAWEKTILDLAGLCSLNVPESALMRFSKLGSTFLAKRFDREGKKRIHFMSAMTALGKSDGDNATRDVSYLDIAAFISANGANPRQDLTELWKRIVFNIAVSNTDDHLRNHGFVLTDKGWRLSALYDVNPSLGSDYLSLNITEDDNALSVDLAIEVSEHFGIDKNQAASIAKDMFTIVRENLRKVAEKNGLSKSSIEYMKPAFAATEI